MTHDVGQALLRDAVDDEFGVSGQRRKLLHDVAAEAEVRPCCHGGRQPDQCAAQPEVLERLGAQAAGDLAHLLCAGADGVLHLSHVGAVARGHVPAEVVETEDDTGEQLTHLVMQFERNAAALVLLRANRPTSRRPALELETLEHLVERRAELGDLAAAAGGRDPGAGVHQVDAVHEPCQAFQGPEAPPDQQEVQHEHEGHADGQDGDLAVQQVGADRRR